MAQLLRIVHLIPHDRSEHFVLVRALERMCTDQSDIQQHSERPYVHFAKLPILFRVVFWGEGLLFTKRRTKRKRKKASAFSFPPWLPSLVSSVSYSFGVALDYKAVDDDDDRVCVCVHVFCNNFGFVLVGGRREEVPCP